MVHLSPRKQKPRGGECRGSKGKDTRRQHSMTYGFANTLCTVTRGSNTSRDTTAVWKDL